MGEKIKFFVYGLVPAIVLNIVQAFALMIVAIFQLAGSIDDIEAALAAEDQTRAVYEYITGAVAGLNITATLAIYLIISFIIELLIIRFAYKERNLKGNIQNINGKAIGTITLAVLGLGVSTSYILNIVYELFPKLMESYDRIMDSLGLTDSLSLAIILCSVIGAPVVEEIAFRKITLACFERAFGKFWIANICQAIIFGVVHGNIVQGIYAFCFGLVLGYIRHRYDSVYASIIGHILFNFYGTVVTSLLSYFAGNLMPIIPITIGFLIFALGMYYMMAKEGEKA